MMIDSYNQFYIYNFTGSNSTQQVLENIVTATWRLKSDAVTDRFVEQRQDDQSKVIYCIDLVFSCHLHVLKIKKTCFPNFGHMYVIGTNVSIMVVLQF